MLFGAHLEMHFRPSRFRLPVPLVLGKVAMRMLSAPMFTPQEGFLRTPNTFIIPSLYCLHSAHHNLKLFSLIISLFSVYFLNKNLNLIIARDYRAWVGGHYCESCTCINSSAHNNGVRVFLPPFQRSGP